MRKVHRINHHSGYLRRSARTDHSANFLRLQGGVNIRTHQYAAIRDGSDRIYDLKWRDRNPLAVGSG